jgi:hypothetical protein
MSIDDYDDTNVPVYIYLSPLVTVAVDVVNRNQIMNEEHDVHNDAIAINDNNDDEVSYYDAQNANETQKENVNDDDNENNESNQLVIINNSNNNIGTNDNDTPNDSNNVIAIDNNDNENDKYESVEAMVVTDGSVLTDPSHSTKKKTKTNNIITSPASNLRSKSLPAKRKILPPVKLNYVSTQSTINNSNKRKIVTSSSTPASKKTSSTTSPSKKKTPPPTSITHATPTTLKLPPPPTEKEYSDREMRVFEKEVADALKQHEKDSTNDDLYKQFKATERSFNQKLFRVIPRTSSKANSAVWKSDYCREIHVTAYAEQYFKTGMNYVFHLFHNNTLLTIVL